MAYKIFIVFAKGIIKIVNCIKTCIYKIRAFELRKHSDYVHVIYFVKCKHLRRVRINEIKLKLKSDPLRFSRILSKSFPFPSDYVC